MHKHSAMGKGRKDMYYYLAKETGFRSRASFKLLQLEKKYGFLQESQTCLDLCAAPGGWSQVAVKFMPVGSHVIAVDLDPIKPIPGVTSFQGDITTQSTSDTITKLLNGAMLDVCVHDGAPNATGDYSADSYNQNVLVLQALKLACKHLKKGGAFVTKVFRTGEYLQLQYVFKQLFDNVETTKPRSSRDSSAEVFTVCRGFKNAEVDANLFDPNVVLRTQQDKQTANLQDLADKLDLRIRHRGGYDNELTKKYYDIVSFVVSLQPIGILGVAGEICFVDDIATDYRFKDVKTQILTETIKFNKRAIGSIEEYNRIQDIIRKLTPGDIQALFTDIKVLSKKDLREILRWRETVLSEVCSYTVVSYLPELKEYQAEEQAIDANPADLQERQFREQQIARQRYALRHMKKTEKKQARKLANFDSKIVDENVVHDSDIFSLKDVRRGELDEEQMEFEEQENEEADENSDVVRIGKEEVNTALDREKYLDDLDENMDIYYENYMSAKKKRENRIKELQEIEQKAEGRADIGQAADTWFKQQEFKTKESAEERQFEAQFPLPKDALSKTRAHEKRVKALAREARELSKQNRLLEELREEHKVGDIAGEEQKDFAKQWKKLGVESHEIELMEKVHYGAEEDESEEEEEDGFSSADGSAAGEAAHEQPADGEGEKLFSEKKKSLGMLLAHQNLDETATKLALAKCMTNKKQRRLLEESAYNRNTFYLDDQDNLPKWFLDEEREHNQPSRPLTSEEIQEIRQQLAELNQRPRTKKEREALARKRSRAQMKMTAIYEKTQQLINREDLTEREKIKQLKKLQSSTEQKDKKKRVVYSNLHQKQAIGGKKMGRGVKCVDRRGKKDIRAAKIRKNRGY